MQFKWIVNTVSPVVKQPVVHTAGMKQMKTRQSPHFVARKKVTQADDTIVTRVFEITTLTRSENCSIEFMRHYITY